MGTMSQIGFSSKQLPFPAVESTRQLGRLATLVPTTPDSTGKERDQETGLDYFGARYLSAAQGRWTIPDWSQMPEPVPFADFADPQTLNLYAYVRDNPLGRSDVDGHCPPCVVAAVVGGGVTVGVVAYEVHHFYKKSKERLEQAEARQDQALRNGGPQEDLRAVDKAQFQNYADGVKLAIKQVGASGQPAESPGGVAIETAGEVAKIAVVDHVGQPAQAGAPAQAQGPPSPAPRSSQQPEPQQAPPSPAPPKTADPAPPPPPPPEAPACLSKSIC